MTAPAPPTSKRSRRNTHPRIRQFDSLLLPKEGESHSPAEPNRVRPRLAVYKRRSRKTATSVSMARQDAECLVKIQQLGGVYDPDHDCYVDDDISAGGGKFRPGLEALLREVIAGRYDGIVSYELPRLLRNREEALRFKAIMRTHSADIYTVRFPELSLWGPFAIIYDLAVELAAGELESIRDRNRSQAEFAAKHGIPRGANVPFGMIKVPGERTIPGRTKPLSTLIPDEEPREEFGGNSPATLVRAFADHVIAGASVRTVAAQLNELGYPARNGDTWSTGTLRQLLSNPLLAGFATTGGHYKKKPRSIVATDGSTYQPGRGQEPLRPYTPVLSLEVWDQLCVAMSRNSRKRPRSKNQVLLRGLIRCGQCGGAMVSNGRSYLCQYHRAHPGTSECRGSFIARHRVDAYVVEAVLALLDDPETLDAAQRANRPEISTRIAELQRTVAATDTALQRLALDHARDSDQRSEQRYEQNRKKLLEELQDAERELTSLSSRLRRPQVDALRGKPDVAAAFAALSDTERATVIGELVDRIEIRENTTSTKFDVNRIVVHWNAGT